MFVVGHVAGSFASLRMTTQGFLFQIAMNMPLAFSSWGQSKAVES
jgi:hypothetical protein